jgi:hypothetical protein
MAYSEQQRKEIVDFVCNEIAEGKSLRFVFNNNKDLPNRDTFFNWIDNDKEKSDQYARAMELRQEKIFEEILEIADTPKEGIKKKETDKGVEITTGDMIQHRRLQVDARKWMLGKMNPKKYGDKLETDNNHSGKIEIVRSVKK